MGPGDFTAVAIASCLACAITGAGILAVSRFEDWAERCRVYFMSFAVGVLLTVSLVHLVPRAARASRAAPALLLGGFLGLYLLNRLLHTHLRGQAAHPERVLGIIPMIGIGLHSLIDGVIYAVTFRVAVVTGILVAIGMVLHEFPEGIITFVLLKRGGFPRPRAMAWAFAAAGLTTPLGAMASYPFVSRLTDETLGAMLALSAGALLYVAAGHLLPAVEDKEARWDVVPLLAGVGLALLIIVLEHGAHAH